MNENFEEAKTAGDPSAETTGPPAGDGLQELTERLGEVSAYLSLYLETQRDRLQIAVRKGLWGLAIFPITVVLIAGSILIALSFMAYGTATGLSQVMGDRPWLGFLLTGLLFLILLALIVGYTVKIKGSKGVEKRRQEWEGELASQRKRFGHDAEERAAQA